MHEDALEEDKVFEEVELEHCFCFCCVLSTFTVAITVAIGMPSIVVLRARAERRYAVPCFGCGVSHSLVGEVEECCFPMQAAQEAGVFCEF